MSIFIPSSPWLLSFNLIFAALACAPLLRRINEAHHYYTEIAPLLARSPEAKKVVDLWAVETDVVDAGSLLRASTVLRTNLYGFDLVLMMSRLDSYGADRLVDDQLGYDLARHPIPEQGLALDIGGNIGLTAILLAKLNPESRIVSFEPLPPNRFYFELNLALNGVSHGLVGVEVHPDAVMAGNRRQLNMSYHPTLPAASGLYWAPSGFFDTSIEQVFEVNTTSIDAILADLDTSKVDLLKLDCEGCEYTVVPALQNSTIDRIDYAIGDIHLHYAHLFDVEVSRTVHAVLCGRGWGITHLLCSLDDLHNVLQPSSPVQKAPGDG